MPARAYTVLAAIAGLAGLAAGAVTLQFFALGRLHAETDPVVRQALVTPDVLMVASKLLAFAALLPRRLLRTARLPP